MSEAPTPPATRCTHCGYDCSGIDSDLCPECGKKYNEGHDSLGAIFKRLGGWPDGAVFRSFGNERP